MSQTEVPESTDIPDPKTVPDTHPIALRYFFWGEFAERSSYYGMRAILFMYLTSALHFADTTATPVYSAFKMACYFLPLVGGFIADRWLGRYWTIVGFSVPYVLGHFILGIETRVTLFIALALLACGSGVIKPNISTMMGETYDQQRPGKKLLRSSAFLWFYFSINVGALISQFALPFLRDEYGYAVAFQFPAWLMVASLTVFALGKKHYGSIAKKEDHIPIDWPALGRLFGVFGLIIFFWVAYEHNDTLWVAFTRDYVNLKLFGRKRSIAPDQLQFINALFVLILVPTFNFTFKKLDPSVRVFTPMRKILAGFMLTAAAAGIMSSAGFLAEGHTKEAILFQPNKEDDPTETDIPAYAATTVGLLSTPLGQGPMVTAMGIAPGQSPETVSTTRVSMLWIVMAYIVLTFGEVLLYGTALELAYTAAPKSIKGLVTACFLLTNTLGNFINVVWSPMYGGSLKDPIEKRGPLLPGEFFGITAAMVVVAAVVFYFVGRRFERGADQTAARSD